MTNKRRVLGWAAACFLILCAPLARAQSVVQEFFVPLPEDQVRSTLQKLYTSTGSTFDSVISIVLSSSGTKVVYDHWEDGYEVDLDNPTQSTTRVWGDGNNANGIAPGYVNDPSNLPDGTVFSLRNNVSLPRSASTVLYDGRDRVGSTKAIVISRAAWATNPGSVLAGAVEVSSVLDYGTEFRAPIGENVSAASMFEVVDLYVMAAQNGTSVSIDKDANGSFETVVLLNRGESYRVNGGVLKGARVSSTKPVQAHLITGDIGANYESRWFTLYPVEQWSAAYYTPVGTAADGDPAYVFLYNPGTGALPIRVTTQLGTTNLTVATNGVVQYQVPQNSGGKFESTNGLPFFAIEAVGANPSANNVHDWGFSLVPEGNLTPIALVGWGPGSSDLSQNGSPVWVTAIADTTLYVDFDGDRAGPLTDPNGDGYDTNITISALQSRTIYDPDKDQTAMRVYTVDGTLITAAWGQDPAVAGAGNPFLDLGTTVLPFPEAVIRKTSTLYTDNPPSGLSTNDILEYSITLDNNSLVVLGNVIVLDAPPPSLLYITNSSSRDGVAVVDDAVPPSTTFFPFDESGFVIPILPRGSSTVIKYRARVLASGSIVNGATLGSTTVTNDVEIPPPAGATACNLEFTDGSGNSAAAYSAGGGIYVTLRDADANNDALSVQTINVIVQDAASGDLETIVLSELGVDTNVFRNLSALPSSTSAGVAQQDGTLYVAPGQVLTVSYTDPVFGDVCADSALISTPSEMKVLYLSTDGVDGDASGELDRVNPAANPVDLTTSISAGLGLGSSAVSLSSTTSSNSSSASSLTFSHTAGSGANRLLLVSVAVGSTASTGNNATNVTSVTYGGTAMSLVGSTVDQNPPRIYSALYSLVNPTSGPANVVVSLAAARPVYASASTFTGVNQSTPLGTFTNQGAANGTTGYNSAALTNIVSAADELVFDVIAVDGENNTLTLSPGAGQTLAWSTNQVSYLAAGTSTRPGSALVTNHWTWSPVEGQQYALGAVSIKPAAGGGTNLATFTQTPTLCSTLSLPAGGVITITNFIAVTNGTMTANPSITARLKYGTNTFVTITNPTYTAANSNLTWSTVLSAATNIPSGQAIALEVETAESGVNFDILYDSSNKPSKVSLPVTTVITIDSFEIYDAAYPGGSIVSSANNGNTLYVRTTVSDPFGAYDITSLDLSIDGPGVADDVNVTLSEANVVASNTCSKTYEYAWNTGSTEGSFTLAATAHEGSEGITDTAATSIPLSFLDLGTPCSVAFTFGDNGPVTNQFGTNATICVRVTDIDQNTNSATFDSLTATLTSSTGDVEPLLLTETATNSGIFTACIAGTNLTGFVSTNGVISVPAGGTVTLDYTDPDDSTDPCSAIATVPPPAGTPGLTVTKTLLSPMDGQALVGEAVQFRIRAINTGSTTLNPVVVTDTFNSASLTYSFASPSPTTNGAGSLVWTNVGPLTPGSSADILVNFTALATASPTTNRAIGVASGLTRTGTATVVISRPQHQITKSLVSPSGPIGKGSNVTFSIVITNTGTTAITNLPVEDTFSGACFDFVSATPSPDSVAFGSLLWNDITGAGSLPIGGTTNITVTLQVVGGCDPAVNLASANYSVDTFNDPVPPVDSSVSVTTLAARITGAVYNDIDRSGTLTGGDIALSGITVRLYTDPNGDGNPADGVLVDLMTTLSDGSYEFLNLGAGNYVVVETDLLSYSSTGDVVGPNDNRIPVVISTLTTYSGNNFFDAQFPAIQVQKTVNSVELATGTNGTPVTYAFVAYNGGSITLTNVVVSDPLLPFTTNIGTLVIGQSKTVSVASVISADLTNTVTATGQYFGTGTVSAVDTAIVDRINPAINVEDTVSLVGMCPGAELAQGTNDTPVTYCFIVSNPGDVALTNVVVTNTALGFTQYVGSLAPGEAVTVSVAGVISADLTNTASATGYDVVGNPVADIDPSAVDLISPALTVAKTVNGVELVQGTNGTPVTYSFEIVNVGDVALTNIVVDDPLIGYTTNVGTLAVGETSLVSFAATITNDLTNTVSVTGEPPAGPPVSTMDTAVVDRINPEISIVNTVGTGAFPGSNLATGTNGTPITYWFVVSNPGDVDLSDVTVTNTDLGITTNLGTLLVGQSVTVTVVSTITADLVNTALATGVDPVGGTVTADDPSETDLIDPAITVEKTVNGVESVQGTNNAPVTYSFVVSNAGNVALTNVYVDDPLITYSNLIGDLAVGQSVTVTVDRAITADLTNTVTAVGLPVTGIPVSDTDTAEVDLIAPGITIDNTVNGVELYQGTNNAPVTYSFVVSNAGDVTLTNVVVTNSALGFTTNLGTLAVGQSVTVTVDTVISGDLTNSAVATGEDPVGGIVTDNDPSEVDLIAPAIGIEKTVNGVELVQGTNSAPVTYAFVVSNEGDVALTNVVVNDTALSFTTNVGSLAVSQVVTLTVDAVISADLTNTVVATGEDPNGDEYTDEDTAEVDLIAPVIGVEKTVNDLELVQGTNNTLVTYAFVVSNEGDVALTNVVLNDALLSFTTNVGTLAVGQSVTVEVAGVISGDLTNTVSATGEDPNGDEYTDDDTAEVDLIAPAITIDNTVNGVELYQGTNNAPVTYAFVVSNSGDVALTNVVVTNAALGFTTNLGTLAVGQSVTVTVDTVISGDLTNSAVATGEDPVGGIVTDNDPSEVDLIAPAITVEKTVNGVELVQGTNNAPVTYAFVVSNEGDVALTNVVVNDTTLSYSTNLGTLAVGQVVTVEVASAISADLTNTVDVAGEDPNGDEYTDDDTAEVDLIAPAITIDNTVNGVELVQGTNNAPVTYSFVVSNAGDVTLTNVVVTNAALGFTTNLGTLAVGQSVTVTVESVISADLTNIAVAVGEDPVGGLVTDDNDSAVDLIAPGIDVAKTVNGVELVQGTNTAPVTYAFVVSNTGDVALTNVVVDDVLLSFTTNLGSLAVGQSATVEVASTISGDLTNTVSAAGEDPNGDEYNDDDTAEVDLIAPGISIEKTVNGVELVQGTNNALVTYAFVVSNTGDVALTNVVVNDTTLSFTTNLGTLAVSEVVTVTVDSAISGDLTNTVAVTGKDPNGDEWTDEDTAEVDLIAPAITIDNTVNGVELYQGTNNAPVTYSFVVSNAGDVALTNVVVTNAALGFTTNLGTLAVGQSVTVTVDTVISGDLTNSAVATGEDPVGGIVTDNDPSEVDLIAPGISVAKTVNGVELVQGTNNAPVTYAFVVSNEGDVALTNVVVNDTTLSYTTNLGTLAVGQVVTVEVASAISADLTNTVDVAGEDPNGDEYTDDDTAEVDLIAPAITIDNTVNGVELYQGTNNAPVTYSFVVSNAGDVTLTNVVVTNSALGFTTNLGTLAVGQSVTVTVDTVISGDLTNSAVATGEDPVGGIVTDNDPSEVDLIAPAITVEKTVNGVELVQGTNGAPVTYSMIVSNAGDVALTNVVLNDATLSFTTNLGTLAVSEVVTVTVDSAISADLTNTVTVTGEDPNGDEYTDDDTAEVDLIAPAIGVEKTVDGVEFVQGTNGAPVTYAFVVSNLGDVALTNVAVDDTTLSYTTNLGTLAIGQVVTVEVTATISADLTNTVAVTGEDPNGDEYTDSDSASVGILMAIYGSVFVDQNGNGSFDPADTVGIAGVTVTLLDSGNAVVGVTTTDVNGAYAFTNRPTGNYTVVETDPAGYYSTGDTSTPNDNQIPVVLSGGVDSTGNDFLDAQPGTIGDFIWHDIDGDGIQNGGSETGLVGVTVNLVDAGTNIVATTTTDASGAYTFTNVLPGAYAIEVVLPANYFFGPQDQGGDDDLDSDVDPLTARSDFVTVDSGDAIENLDAALYQPATLGNFVWLDVNGNGLQDGGSETGLPNVVVSLFNTNGVLIAATTTDVNGVYLFTNLAPAYYVVGYTSPPGYQVTARDVGLDDTLDSDPLPATGLTAPTQMLSGEVDLSWSAGMYLPASLGGQVFEDQNYNSVQDSGEVTMLTTGLTVNLYRSDNTFVTSTVTDVSGVYLFTNLPPGSYVVEFTKATNLVFVTPQEGSDPTLDSDPDQVSARTPVITLESGQVDQTWGAGLARFGAIGDFVWWDLNNDGEHNEALSFYGLNGVNVRLYRISGATTSFVASTVTTTDTNGQKGAYSFTSLEFGDYYVVVDTAGVPSYLSRRTTVVSYRVSISPQYTFFDADFGFNTDPTPISLKDFRAFREDDGVHLEWETVSEFENLGFNLYRASDAEGSRTKLNGELILGQGTGSGGVYTFVDADADRAVTWYYWLEDVSWDFRTKLHGPVVLRGEEAENQNERVAQFQIGATTAGIYRITYEVLVAAGLPAASLETDRVKVLVDGEEIAIATYASGATLKSGDSLLFYLPEHNGAIHCEIQTGPDALRMGWAYAAPLDEGSLWTGVVQTDGQLPFTVSPEWSRYLLMGFENDGALVFDVADPQRPLILFGYASLYIPGQSGLYLSHDTEQPASCIAVQPSAVHDVTGIAPTP